MSYDSNSSSKGQSRRRNTTLLTSPTSEQNGFWESRRTSSSETRQPGSAAGLDEATQLAPSVQLDAIPGTPRTPRTPRSQAPNQDAMSLDRSPIIQSNGSWSSPGLNVPRTGKRSGSSSPRRARFVEDPKEVRWTSAQANGADIKGFSPIPTSSGMFPRRLFRQLSISLPRFNRGTSNTYAEKEKLGRGRIPQNSRERLRNLGSLLCRIIWRLRARLAVLVGLILMVVLFYKTPAHRIWLRTSWLGGGNKFVVIIAANQGGGVMEWKGPREWAIERDSVRNKKSYVARHGYDLEIVDMAIKKRYAHEWRESWEKVDTIRRCLKQYPKAEWFWWLDLNTFIMEPSYSLQHHLFNNLAANVYRDINVYNPLNITHPPSSPYLDAISASPVGDNLPSSIDMVVPQDCSGFNLGSFFMRRSAWTDRLLDVWWDPVQYEQRHMQWEHKEQDAFEYLYTSQPWVRTHTAFVPQRKVCSFPKGACGENNGSIHYNQHDRDFVVNMAGCEWGRDCWGEMYSFRELSNWLNRTPWEKFQDGSRGFFGGAWRKVRREKEKEKGVEKGKTE